MFIRTALELLCVSNSFCSELVVSTCLSCSWLNHIIFINVGFKANIFFGKLLSSILMTEKNVVFLEKKKTSMVPSWDSFTNPCNDYFECFLGICYWNSNEFSIWTSTGTTSRTSTTISSNILNILSSFFCCCCWKKSWNSSMNGFRKFWRLLPILPTWS